MPLDSETAARGRFVDVSPLDEIPEPWRGAMEAAGTYSIRDLARKANLGTSTVSKLIYGRSSTSERTMQAVADSLRVEVPTIREWASAARGEAGPFSLPPEANRLSRRQRAAVIEVVRAMLEPVEPPRPDLSTAEGFRLADPSPAPENAHRDT